MEWQYGVILGIFRTDPQAELQCLTQMFVTEEGAMRMGLFMLLDAEEVSVTCNSWCGALYRCGSHLVDAPRARAMRTFRLPKLAEQLWAMGEQLWAGGGRLLQQHSMPLQHVGLLYCRPSRSAQPCGLCRSGGTVHWRCTVRLPGPSQQRKAGAVHIVHLCEDCQALAVPLLSLQLQLREWRHHRLVNKRSKPVDDVVALNLLFPFVKKRGPHQAPVCRALPWADARKSLEGWLPPLP